MKRKKLMCIICAFLILFSEISPVYASFWDDFLDIIKPGSSDKMSETLHEDIQDATDILGTDIVFMTSVGCFYSNGIKQKYSDIGADDAYCENGSVMIDYKVAEHIFGENIPFLNKTVNNGVEYVNASELGNSLSKYVYESDNRDFVILSDTDKAYSNNDMSYVNNESTDIIWRYMQFERPSGDDIYNKLTQSPYYEKHPRLFLKYDEIDNFKSRIYSDDTLKIALNTVIETADKLLSEPVQEHIINDGLRLFSSCETVKKRLFNLCLAYLLTDDSSKKESYAQRAWGELDNACGWTDWNVDAHLLDSGRIGPGIAFAYDILYDWLGSERRQSIRDRVTVLYLDECVNMYTGDSKKNIGNGSKNLSSNWGAVNGTSMFMLAITFMDEEASDSILTKKCKYIAANSLQTYEHILTSIAPDGVWSEGAGYYEYVMQHLAWTLEVLNNVFDSADFNNFLKVPGVDMLPEYAIYTNANNGSFNKSSTTGTEKYYAPEAFIYAKLYGRNDIKEFYKNYRESIGVTSHPTSYLLFYEPSSESAASFLLDKYFQSIGTGVMRGSWFDHSGTYTAISGGRTGSVDSHYDKGSFIFDANGERWSIDLGRNGNATMPFLLRTETHSALSIAPSAENIGQMKDSPAQLIYSESKDKAALMVYDLGNIYSQWVNSYKRGFLLGDDRNTLTIQDELVLNEDNPLVWNMVTKADIDISQDGKSAVLTQNGKKLLVTALCSEDGWSFSKTDDMAPTGGWVATDLFTVDQQKKFAAGAKKLCLKANGSGEVTISVKLTPVVDDENFTTLDNIPISDWVLPDGDLKQIIRFVNIKNDDKFFSDSPVYFSVNVDGDFSELNILIDNTSFANITKSNLKRVYEFIIPGEYFSLAGDYALTAEAVYPNHTIKKSIIINVKQVHSSDNVFNLHFNELPQIWDSYDELKKGLGVSAVFTNPNNDDKIDGEVLHAKGLDGSKAAMKMSLLTTSAPYISMYHSGKISGSDIISLSFDAITNATDMRLYLSFTLKNGKQCSVFQNKGTFLNTDVKYQANVLYHINFIIDNVNGVYTAVITDSEDRLVVIEEDTFDIGNNNFDQSRMTFSTLHSGDEERYFIIDNFSLSKLNYTSVQTETNISDKNNLSIEQLVYSDMHNVSELTSYIAYYNQDNCLTDVKISDVSNGNISVFHTFAEDVSYAKIMLWDNNMQPICRVTNIYNHK